MSRSSNIGYLWEEVSDDFIEEGQGFFTEEKDSDGTIIRRNRKGQRHNTRGPAVVYDNGSVWYYQNGKVHRTDGPAFIGAKGVVEYWVDDKRIPKEQFYQLYGQNRIASEDPSFDYDTTRNNWFENEPDAPALNSLDFQQDFQTDLSLPDTQRSEKELVDWNGRENLQLSTSKKDTGSLFICFMLPKDAYEVLKDVNKLDDELHMTMFYADVNLSDDQKKQILEDVSDTVKKHDLLTCNLTGIGSFGDEDKTTVALVDVQGATDLYNDLKDTIESVTGELELTHGFIPHVSLDYAGTGKSDLSVLPEYKWTADELYVKFSEEEIYLIKLKTGDYTSGGDGMKKEAARRKKAVPAPVPVPVPDPNQPPWAGLDREDPKLMEFLTEGEKRDLWYKYIDWNTYHEWWDSTVDYWTSEKLPPLGYDDAEIRFEVGGGGSEASFSASVDFDKVLSRFPDDPIILKVLKYLRAGLIYLYGKIRTDSQFRSSMNLELDYEVNLDDGDWITPITSLVVRGEEYTHKEDIENFMYDASGHLEDVILEDAGDLAHKIYKELDGEYDYLSGEESVLENILINGIIKKFLDEKWENGEYEVEASIGDSSLLKLSSWEEFQDEYLEDWQGFYREEKDQYGIIWRYNKKGQVHNTRGPAVIHPNGTLSYWVNHKRHRTDGPARIWADGSVAYWVDNKELSEEEFNRLYGQNRQASLQVKAEYFPEPYMKLLELMTGRRSKPKTSLKIQGKRSTTLEYDLYDGTFSLRYHATRVIKFYPYSFELNSGGWYTAMTKARINDWLSDLGIPVYVYQRDYDWFVSASGVKDISFADGMKFDYDGNLIDGVVSGLMVGGDLTKQSTWEEFQDEYLEDWQGFFTENKFPNGNIRRYNKKGQLHNTRGPAVIDADGSVEYWVDGKHLSEEEFNRLYGRNRQGSLQVKAEDYSGHPSYNKFRDFIRSRRSQRNEDVKRWNVPGSSHTQIRYDETYSENIEPPPFVVRLYFTDILKFYSDRVVLNHGGWMSNLTSSRTNHWLYKAGIPGQVFRKNNEWWYSLNVPSGIEDYEEWYRTHTYKHHEDFTIGYDGIPIGEEPFILPVRKKRIPKWERYKNQLSLFGPENTMENQASLAIF